MTQDTVTVSGPEEAMQMWLGQFPKGGVRGSSPEKKIKTTSFSCNLVILEGYLGCENVNFPNTLRRCSLLVICTVSKFKRISRVQER